MSAEQMVTVEEAARITSCHPVTIRRMIQRGELPALRVGRRYRVRLSDLEPEVLGSRPAAAARREPSGSLSRIAAEIARSGGRNARA